MSRAAASLAEGNRKKQRQPGRKAKPLLKILFTSLLTCRSFFPCVSEKVLLNPILRLKGGRKIPALRKGRCCFFLLSLEKGTVLRDLLKMLVCAPQ